MSGFMDIRTPLIPDDQADAGAWRQYLGGATALAHVYWDQTGFHDSKGNSWTVNGTPPVNALATTAGYPWNAGVFSDANYYSLGTGAGPLNFATGTSFIVVVAGICSIQLISNSQIAFSNENVGLTAGCYLGLSSAGDVGQLGVGASTVNTANAFVPNVPFVLSGGCNSTTAFVKLNMGPTNSATLSYTTNAANPSFMGRFVNAASSCNSTAIFEFYAALASPSNQLLTNINRLVLRGLGQDPADYNLA